MTDKELETDDAECMAALAKHDKELRETVIKTAKEKMDAHHRAMTRGLRDLRLEIQHTQWKSGQITAPQWFAAYREWRKGEGDSPYRTAAAPDPARDSKIDTVHKQFKSGEISASQMIRALHEWRASERAEAKQGSGAGILAKVGTKS